MDKTQWASFKAAIKTLDSSPKKIKEAKNEYNTADAYMRDPAHRRTWSEEGQRNFYAAAAEKRDKVIKAECEKMKKALETVRAYQDYPGEAIDLNSAKLQNALAIVNSMKDKTPHAVQVTILNSFKGEPAALQFLGDLFDANGLYYSQLAREMAKPISQEALSNIDQSIAAYEWNGEWDEHRTYWTQNSFNEYAERMGFGSETADPFVNVLKTMRKKTRKTSAFCPMLSIT